MLFPTQRDTPTQAEPTLSSHHSRQQAIRLLFAGPSCLQRVLPCVQEHDQTHKSAHAGDRSLHQHRDHGFQKSKRVQHRRAAQARLFDWPINRAPHEHRAHQALQKFVGGLANTAPLRTARLALLANGWETTSPNRARVLLGRLHKRDKHRLADLDGFGGPQPHGQRFRWTGRPEARLKKWS